MNRNSYLCQAHIKEADLFCLCESSPLFICPTCLPKHEGHDIYPIAQSELFQAIGKDKAELKRRNILSKKCQGFLDRVMEREDAVQSEAKRLITAVNENYGIWIERNHHCFDNLLTTMREETALLLTRAKYRVSSITQKLFDKVEILDSEGEKRFTRIPEMETLKSLNDCSQEACSRVSKVWQEDYEDEVLQALTIPHQANKRRRSPSFNNEEVEQLNLKLEETTAKLQALQADFQAKTQHCTSLEQEKETWKQRNQAQVNQVNESKLRLERISELERQCKELNNSMEAKTRQFQTLQTDLQAKAQSSLTLEKEKQSLSTQLTESKSGTERNQRRITELETAQKELTAKFDALKFQLQVVQTELQNEHKRCLSLEYENKTLKKQLEVAVIKADHDLAEANQKVSVLEARLLKREMINDPPNESPQPVLRCSTPQSIATLTKLGPYPNQDTELVLVKRGPIREEEGVYIGHWNTRNQKHGHGQLLYQNGDVYEGQWQNGSKNGKGRNVWADGTAYVGDFKQNQMDGFGRFYYANGDEYSGAWINGKMHGVDSFVYKDVSQPSRDRYIGEYLDGERTGIGARFGPNGSMYVGYWKSNMFHGKGLYGWPSGAMYIGDYVDNLKSGTGCYLSANGDVYKGEWKAGRRNGQGRLIHPGAVEEGVWVDDILRNMSA